MSSRAEADTLWCQSTFAMLAEGGKWGVPRSGLIFRKQGAELILDERMPWIPELDEALAQGLDVPRSAAELEAYQDGQFAEIVRQFGLAGITVRVEGQA